MDVAKALNQIQTTVKELLMFQAIGLFLSSDFCKNHVQFCFKNWLKIEILIITGALFWLVVVQIDGFCAHYFSFGHLCILYVIRLLWSVDKSFRRWFYSPKLMQKANWLNYEIEKEACAWTHTPMMTAVFPFIILVISKFDNYWSWGNRSKMKYNQQALS